MNQLDSTIKDQFVSSLMNYFKIEEDINLRAHIADLTQAIERVQYREFFRRLSHNEYAYKGAFEKIALVVRSFEQEYENELFAEVTERVNRLYSTLYELHKMIVLDDDRSLSEEARFCRVHFARLKNAQTQELLLDDLDIEVVKALGKAWIFHHVAYDKSLFLKRVELEYKNAIVRRHHENNTQEIAPSRTTHRLMNGSR